MTKERPPGEKAGRTRNAVVIRTTPEYKAWLDGLADHLGTPLTGAIDRALRELAKREGYTPPPRRY